MNPLDIRFEPLHEHPPGILHRMLLESYRELIKSEPEHWATQRQEWRRFDHEAFDQPDTVGACVFVTMLESEPVGFGSFDPRELPARGIVGHNCVLPTHRRQGIGTLQLEAIVRRLSDRGARLVAATTSEHPFFLPARRMYQSAGFHVAGRRVGGPDPEHHLVDYVLRP